MKTILALGEVLWDVYPDGPRFGGAPANFACACSELGGPAVRVCLGSAVGPDALGDSATRHLTQHGVDITHISTANRPTGQVFVSLDTAKKASYRFLDDAAWDHLTATPELLHAAATADVVCFGTLGQRAERSRDAIRRAVRSARPDCLRVLDINLRPPHWTPEAVRESLPLANVLKLNDEELPQVAAVLGISGSETDLLRELIARYTLKLVALTRGPHGSRLLAADGTDDECPAIPTDTTNTVGAGDVFTAALVLGLTFGHPLTHTHRRATEAAAFVCTQAEATPAFPPHLHLVG